MSELKGIVHGLDEADYHAHPALSSHKARAFLANPAKFRWEQDHGVREAKQAWDLGTAAHTKILGTGSLSVVYPDEHLTPSGKPSEKKVSLEWAAEQRALGLVPVTPDWDAAVDAMAESVLANTTARELLEQPGHAEASIFVTDPVTGIDIRCRTDYLPDGEDILLVDLKTARDASPDAFAYEADKFGYHVQRSFNLDCWGIEMGTRAADMRFVVVETSPPYLTAVYSLDLEFCDMGDAMAREARRRYALALEHNDWPGYPEGVTEIKPRVAAIYAFQDRFGSLEEMTF